MGTRIRRSTENSSFSTDATNCNRLHHEAVKWRSPCVWPRLISYNVVFYVMPPSPRTFPSLQLPIDTLNQTVSLWHSWACVPACFVCVCVGLCVCAGVLFSAGCSLWGVEMSILHNMSWGFCAFSVCVCALLSYTNANFSRQWCNYWLRLLWRTYQNWV